jgi:putative pantetheine hydrolase
MTLAGGSLAGPTNCLTDVAGVRVGHYGRSGDGWLSGTTVVLAPPGGAVAGVDVRGGGPGTHETDALDPRNLVERVHAVVLGGGSAFGLAAVAGVMERLADEGEGFPVGLAPGEVVPIVPAAVLFDLGRGGAFRHVPDASFGASAFDAASAGPVQLGGVGAGTGALAGGLKGGVGSASVVLDERLPGGGATVAALVVVNAAGSLFDPAVGELYGARFGLAGEFDALSPPADAELAAAAEAVQAAAVARAGTGAGAPFHTTIGVVATDATLTKAQCQKLAGVAHDGMARAIRPVHSLFDGDTVFALATGGAPDRPATGDPPDRPATGATPDRPATGATPDRPATGATPDRPATGATPDRPAALDPLAFNAVLAAGADAFSRAIVHGMLAATTVGDHRSYADTFPTAVRGWSRG